MTVYRKVERFADPHSGRTPARKEPDPQLGYAFIPAARYVSNEFRQLEWERLWTKVWLLGCWEKDLAKAGDYVVTQIGKESIVREMPLNERGELIRDWPGGFFEEGLRELLI